MMMHRLRDVAMVLTSNVDKVIDPDEHPVRLCNYVDVYKNNFIHNEITFKPGSATATEIKKFGVRVDDVIITKDSETPEDIGVPALVKSTADDLVCGYHLSILRADRRRMIGSFLYWHLLSKKSQEDFGNAANGVTRYGLTLGGIKSIPINVPDLATQRQIADFLDRETARIDLLIEKKQRLVALLEEEHGAVIAHSVTKGVNSNAPMKDSGEDWLGKIPAHWEVVPPTALFTESKERAHDGDEMLSATQKYGVIPLAKFEALEQRQVTKAFTNLEKRKHVEVGDFVISMRSMDGGLEQAHATGSVRSSYSVLKAGPAVEGRFFRAILKSCLYIQALRLTSNFIRDGQDMNFGHFRKVRLPKPPIDEQTEIANLIEEQTTRIKALVSKTNSSVGLIKEYRCALITAAVTGQIDVETYSRSGTTNRRLDAIQEEMSA